MYLIVGLGNPGEKYKNNRHNVGHMFIDFIAPLLHCSIVKREKSYITMKQLNHETIVLSKPLTFMNLSGQAVKNVLADYRLPITDLLVVHDDLDIPLGKFKIQKGIGPRLHNGIESIENSLGTKEFWRIRIGVDNRLALSERSESKGWIDGETYVLQDFRPEEKKIIEETVFKAIIARLPFLRKIRKNSADIG